MKTIHYSQCWEDPKVLTETLKIEESDEILSIASAGDNTFALLLQNPKSITAIDFNPLQLYLIELKIKALELLDYNIFVSFLGARPSKERLNIYKFLRIHLSSEAREYWDNHEKSIKQGIIHCGKFEKYFNIFRRFVVPLIHSKRKIKKLFACLNIKEQDEFYNKFWNNRRWRFVFRIFFGKFILGNLGRDPSFFQHVSMEKIGDELFNRSKHGLTNIPIKNNLFLEYIFLGNYSNLEKVHPYLSIQNFNYLKNHLSKIKLVKAGFADYVKSLPNDSIDKFNLSDIFEYMSKDEFINSWKEINRVGRNNSSVAFWTLFNQFNIPEQLKTIIHNDQKNESEIKNRDRGFFYGGFSLWEIIKPAEKKNKKNYVNTEEVETDECL